MSFDRRPVSRGGVRGETSSLAARPPGKHTLTEQIVAPAQARSSARPTAVTEASATRSPPVSAAGAAPHAASSRPTLAALFGPPVRAPGLSAPGKPAPAGADPGGGGGRPSLEAPFGGRIEPPAVVGVRTVPAGDAVVLAGGGGAPLPSPLRKKMEAAFATDFSAIRVHEGEAAPAMGALAYTYGNDIHCAPGRFDPSSPAGQELIGHELTHVVQQRTGRVAASQGNGAGVNADPVLEAEADALGAAAARGEAVQTAGGGTGGDSAARGGAAVGAIQRKVGFEFQIPTARCWQAAPEHLGDGKVSSSSAPTPLQRLPKKQLLLKGSGFELQADDGSVQGTSELEIVTDAFEEDEAGAKAMKHAMSCIVKLCEQFQVLRADVLGGNTASVPAGALDGFGDVIAPEGNLLELGECIYVKPQATGAIRLDQLFKVMEDFASRGSVRDESAKLQGRRAAGRKACRGGKPEFGEAVTLATAGLAQYRTSHHLDDWQPSAELKSLLGLVLSYLIMGREPIPTYPKTIAPLLSRTPLHVLFAMLPVPEKEMFHEGALLPLVQAALPALDLTRPVFEGGIYWGSDFETKRARVASQGGDLTAILERLTRERWIASIPVRDLLTREAFAETFPDPAGAMAAEELESLGSWPEPGMVGSKEPENRIPGGIFELRTLNKIKYTWIPLLADAFYHYVVAVNQGKQAYFQLDEKRLK